MATAMVPNTGAANLRRSSRLPVYFLLDCSSSMGGEPLAVLTAGLELFRDNVEADASARDLVYVGVITFGASAERVGSLVAIDRFLPKSLHLSANGPTRLDLGFSVLQQAMVDDALAGGHAAATDFQPLVFVFTDGSPTDAQGYASANWMPTRAALLNPDPGLPRPASLVAIGCGPNVTDATLKDISTGTWWRLGPTQTTVAAGFGLISTRVLSTVGVLASALADANAAAARAGVAAGAAHDETTRAGAFAEAAKQEAHVALTHANATRSEAQSAQEAAGRARHEADRAADSAGSAGEFARFAEDHSARADLAARRAGAEAGIAIESAGDALAAAEYTEVAVETAKPAPRSRPPARARRAGTQRT